MIKKLMLITGLLFLTACAAKPPAVVGPIELYASDNLTVLISPKLANQIRLANIAFEQKTFSRVQLNIDNLLNERLTLEYQFSWVDDKGFLVSTSTPWQRKIISPMQTTVIGSTGKTPDSKKVTLKIRYPDDLYIEEYRKDYENYQNSR